MVGFYATEVIEMQTSFPNNRSLVLNSYIVDFENAQDITGTNFEWDEYYWRIWGLFHRFGGPDW